MRKTRLGFVGAGVFSELCLAAYQQFLPEVEVVAITDLNVAQAEKVAKRWKIMTVSRSPTDLFRLDLIDTVIILTRPDTHFQLASEALEKGKNVLVEKPIAFSEMEARRLIELAESRGKSIAANLVLRYHPFNQQIREIVESKKMGRLKSIVTQAWLARYPEDHWYWDKNKSGGFFLNTYCHFIDLYNYIVGKKPIEFRCQQKPGHAHLIELDFLTTKTTLLTNLDARSDQESVETKYMFVDGAISTFGWLPERMIILDGDRRQELDDDLTKDARYKQLLASLLKDLIDRGHDRNATSRVNHDVLWESVRQPLVVASRLK